MKLDICTQTICFLNYFKLITYEIILKTDFFYFLYRCITMDIGNMLPCLRLVRLVGTIIELIKKVYKMNKRLLPTVLNLLFLPNILLFYFCMKLRFYTRIICDVNTHQRADRMKITIKKTNQTEQRNTALSNTIKLWAILCRDGWVMVESSDKMWSTTEGNGKSFQYSCFEDTMNSMKRQKDRTLKDELPRLVDTQYATEK